MIGETGLQPRRAWKPPCRVLDGWIAGGREVWVVVARSRTDLTDLLAAGEVRICRAVRPDGVLVLGHATHEQDPLISTVLGEGGVAPV